MKYLFLDLEMAHSKNDGKICEFGYVLTNEKFEILKEENLIINPNIERKSWDWFALKKIMKKTAAYYERGKTFDKYYPRIKTLLEEADFIFGHSINNDVKTINAELRNFNYQPLTFYFYDVKNIYKEYENIQNDVSLENIAQKFNIVLEGQAHEALYDAKKTMLEFRYMIEKLNLAVDEVLDLCPTSKFLCKEYTFSSCYKDVKIVEAAEISFRSFVKSVEPNHNAASNLLYGKKVYIMYSYTRKYVHEAKNLVKLISDLGGSVVLKVADSDIFVEKEMYDNNSNLLECNSKKIYNFITNEGNNIDLIKFEELLSILKVCDDDLTVNNYYEGLKFKKKEKSIRKKSSNERVSIKEDQNSHNGLSYSLGELLTINNND